MMKLAATSGVGEMMSEVILQTMFTDTPVTGLWNTHCTRKPSEQTLCDDQYRPYQPVTSPIPQRTAVGSSHQVRQRTASPTCTATNQHSQDSFRIRRME
jgi:hypothetical protein